MNFTPHILRRHVQFFCRLNAETLEPRHMLSAIAFVSRNIGAEESLITSVHASDLDGDGDPDLLTASRDDKISWYENIDGKGTFVNERVIADEVGPEVALFPADLDGDGDADVLSVSLRWNPETQRFDGKVVWYENGDGEAAFGSANVISTQVQGANAGAVAAADLDGDGDLDVLSGYGERGEQIAWYENMDGQGSYGPDQVFGELPVGIKSLVAADMDEDGDLDVVATGGSTFWYENTDGNGTFERQPQITRIPAVGSSMVGVGDVDGDGDQDVITAGIFGLSVDENIDGKGTFAGAQQILTPAHSCVLASDLDGDGDVDLVVKISPISDSEERLAWYENTDGNGTFVEQVIAMGERSFRLAVADLDNDGDIDIVSTSEESVVLYENRLAGDMDDDGEVTFEDFLKLAANFGNVDAGWEVGDFDGNGTVEFADFLILTANFGQLRG